VEKGKGRIGWKEEDDKEEMPFCYWQLLILCQFQLCLSSPAYLCIVQMHFHGLHCGGNVPIEMVAIPVNGTLFHNDIWPNFAQIPVVDCATVIVEEAGEADGHFLGTFCAQRGHWKGRNLWAREIKYVTCTYSPIAIATHFRKESKFPIGGGCPKMEGNCAGLGGQAAAPTRLAVECPQQ
jgi:hypothetical protein